MKIEEITPQKKEKDYNIKDYWFPLPKGYNRLLIVLGCLIIIYAVYVYPQKVNTFIFALLIEVIIYTSTIWIYRGFKELPHKKNEI